LQCSVVADIYMQRKWLFENSRFTT